MLLIMRPSGAETTHKTHCIQCQPSGSQFCGSPASTYREQIIGRARELGALAVNIELIPLVQLADPDAFDYAPFWRELLAECAAAARGLTGSIQEEAEDVASQMEEQAEGLMVGSVPCNPL